MPELVKVLPAVAGVLPPDQVYDAPVPDAVSVTDPQAVVVPEIATVGLLLMVTA